MFVLMHKWKTVLLKKKRKKTKVTIILATSTMNTKQQDKLLQVKDVVGADPCRRNNIIN